MKFKYIIIKVKIVKLIIVRVKQIQASIKKNNYYFIFYKYINKN